jgi:hypothetical protein
LGSESDVVDYSGAQDDLPKAELKKMHALKIECLDDKIEDRIDIE